MSSNPARSSSLPPYAAPAARALAALSVPPAVSFVPFVPPTWSASAEREVQGDVMREASAAAATTVESTTALETFAAPETGHGIGDTDATADRFDAFPIDPSAEFASEAVEGISAGPADEDSAEFADEFTVDSSDDALPWIEAFAVDPEVTEFADPQATAFEHHAMLAAFDEEGRDGAHPEISDESALSNLDESSDAPPVLDSEDDTWVMNEASADIGQLADELIAVSAEASSNAPPATAAEPHLPWQEDEAWMDIMPALPNSGGRDVAAETAWARAFGEPPAPLPPPPLPTGDAQAAAASLELIARRLRAGDLSVPGFHASRGDAAALAAALAALLGAND